MTRLFAHIKLRNKRQETTVYAIDAISQNPFRYLAVYSNKLIDNPVVETVCRRRRRFKEFPLDVLNFMVPIVRTREKMESAEIRLSHPISKIKNAQFWWMNTCLNDEDALGCLLNGDMAAAQYIWGRTNSVSSLQNRLMLAVVSQNYASVVKYGELLYVHYEDEFLQLVLGCRKRFSTPLWQMFLNTLLEAGCDIIPYLTIPAWRDYAKVKNDKVLRKKEMEWAAASQRLAQLQQELKSKTTQKVIVRSYMVLSTIGFIVAATNDRMGFALAMFFAFILGLRAIFDMW